VSELRIGIAGYGVMGKRRKAVLDQLPGTRVVAICDPRFEEDSWTVDGVPAFRGPDRLFSERLDVVLVCTSNEAAPELTIAALERGLHVFCEKPPGRDLEDVARVVEVERRHPGLKLMYGFNHRYHHAVQDALELVRSGSLGRVLNLRGVYGKAKLVTFGQPPWRSQRARAGGGVLLDQGIHMVDLMRMFAGEFEEVHGFVSNRHWGLEVEDNAFALMRTADGVVATLHSSATQWRHRFQLEITLAHGSVAIGGLLTDSRSYGPETLTVVTADPDRDGGDPREQTTRYNANPSWRAELTRFIACIVNDQPVDHGASSDAFQTMKLVQRIYHSDPAWRSRYAIRSPDELPG
jgi:predicted dehydrogenase